MYWITVDDDSVFTGTAADPKFKNYVNRAAREEQKRTLGLTRPKDMGILLVGGQAQKLYDSAEYRTYLTQGCWNLEPEDRRPPYTVYGLRVCDFDTLPNDFVYKDG